MRINPRRYPRRDITISTGQFGWATHIENAKRTVRVNAAGAITLPLIGAVIVAGLTQQEVEGHLANLYGDKYLQDPQISVFIKEFTTERITVDGAVAKPGIYPLVGDMTLLRVLDVRSGLQPEVQSPVGIQAELSACACARLNDGHFLTPFERRAEIVAALKNHEQAL